MNLTTVNINLTLHDSTVNINDICDSIMDIAGIDAIIADKPTTIAIKDDEESIESISGGIAQDICANLNKFDAATGVLIGEIVASHLKKNLL